MMALAHLPTVQSAPTLGTIKWLCGVFRFYTHKNVPTTADETSTRTMLKTKIGVALIILYQPINRNVLKTKIGVVLIILYQPITRDSDRNK
jgi:hypothetical protein